MEDLSRNVAQATQVKGPGRAKRAPRRWTVLLIGDLGKVASFHVTRSLLLALPAFLVAILGVVTYSVVSYNFARLENRGLRRDVDRLRAELETAEKAREKALVGLTVLQDRVEQSARKESPASDQETRDAASRVTKPGPAATASVKASEAPKPRALSLPPTGAKKEKIASPPSLPRIVVKDLKIWQEPESNTFKFQFVLKNIDRESGKIAGYTFLVLKPQEASEEPVRAFPWSPLKDGKPATFKRGQYFSIARFKSVRARLVDVSTISRFKTATVYVYSETGDLLVEEVFEVGKIFRS